VGTFVKVIERKRAEMRVHAYSERRDRKKTTNSIFE
jgi:hypothetical protein